MPRTSLGAILISYSRRGSYLAQSLRRLLTKFQRIWIRVQFAGYVNLFVCWWKAVEVWRVTQIGFIRVFQRCEVKSLSLSVVKLKGTWPDTADEYEYNKSQFFNSNVRNDRFRSTHGGVSIYDNRDHVECSSKQSAFRQRAKKIHGNVIPRALSNRKKSEEPNN